MDHQNLIDYIAVGQRVRAERKKQGISQEELAELAHLSITHVSHIETGGTKLSLPAIMAVCFALNKTPNDFLFDSLPAATAEVRREIAEVTADCDAEEIRIVADTTKALVDSLRRRRATNE